FRHADRPGQPACGRRRGRRRFHRAAVFRRAGRTGDDMIEIDTALARRLVEALARHVIAHAEELTALDQAIGDADHGVNMRRGLGAVLADRDTLAAGDVAALFGGVGRTLVMKVGGASGPLYGTLFMQLGKSWPAELTAANVSAACRAAVDAVAARGKSQP